MTTAAQTSVKRVSTTLFRLLLHPSDAELDGELHYEDDASRFREKGLDIQDFAPSYIDVYHYATRQEEQTVENGGGTTLVEQTRETQLQVFAYSFSYLPDPTWLVNWENGIDMEDGIEPGLTKLHEKTKNLELDMGEYLTGALTEAVPCKEGEARLQILSFTTNKKRELIVNQASESERQYRLQLPEGFGIIGRFPAPRCSFGFYISWMTPKQWSIRAHLWFPESFRSTVRTVLLIFHRLAKLHDKDSQAGGDFLGGLPSCVMKAIIQRLSSVELEMPSDDMSPTHRQLIQ